MLLRFTTANRTTGERMSAVAIPAFRVLEITHNHTTEQTYITMRPAHKSDPVVRMRVFEPLGEESGYNYRRLAAEWEKALQEMS